jgi:hypothetical protein
MVGTNWRVGSLVFCVITRIKKRKEGLVEWLKQQSACLRPLVQTPELPQKKKKERKKERKRSEVK